MSDLSLDGLYDGLQALANSAFPKKCNTCGRTFENAEEFVLETEKLRPSVSGLKQSMDDDGSMIVELFRNCTCGSTLMDAFNDRRDLSSKGEKRRKRFAELQTFLIEEHDVDSIVARNELLKVMRGERSKILSKILPPKK
jgi:hypothetical protein